MAEGSDSTFFRIKKSDLTPAKIMPWLLLFGFASIGSFMTWLRGPFFGYLLAPAIQAQAAPVVKAGIAEYSIERNRDRDSLMRLISTEFDTLHAKAALVENVLCRRYPKECRAAKEEQAQILRRNRWNRRFGP